MTRSIATNGSLIVSEPPGPSGSPGIVSPVSVHLIGNAPLVAGSRLRHATRQSAPKATTGDRCFTLIVRLLGLAQMRSNAAPRRSPKTNRPRLPHRGDAETGSSYFPRSDVGD